MAENVQQSIEVPVGLSVFGSLITEMAPSDLPEGVSPDSQDVVYLPGSVASRPCLHKLYPALPGNVTVTSTKTFITQKGSSLNLILDSSGALWSEDVTNNPGVLVQILSVTPGSYFTSTTAFGREYIAFHDGLHPTDSPVQFNGTTINRVTQDGPGAPPQIFDDILQVNVVASPNGLVAGYQLFCPNIAQGLNQSGFVVTVTLNGSTSSLRVGDLFNLSAATNALYNGNWQISAILDNTHFQFVHSVSGLAPSTHGTITTNCVLVDCSGQSFAAEELVTIAGAGVATYNGTWSVRIDLSVSPKFLLYIPASSGFAASGNGTATLAGQITVGVHQCVLMFLTDDGALTAPSKPFTWNAAGAKRARCDQIAIGPPNVKARVLAFTGAGGGNFFSILESITVLNPSGGASTIIAATVINDNTTTSASIDFSDNALFQATAIDIKGNNLFAQVPLEGALGFLYYASRLAIWGERNRILNLINMSFDGGFIPPQNAATPLGWLLDATGGVLVNSGNHNGMAWQITSNGFANPGMIQQGAYQDSYKIAILTPLTKYDFRVWAKFGGVGTAGNVFAELFSPINGSLAIANIPIATIAAKANGGFFQISFNVATPSVIPSDTILRISTSGQTLTTTVTLDEMSIIYTERPFRDSLYRFSYVNNPEGFDSVTGDLGPTDDSTPIKTYFDYKDILHVLTARGLHETQDSAGIEPSGWNIREISNHCGAVSPFSCDMGENFAAWVSSPITEPPTGRGVYVYTGGSVYKISQENQPIFDSVNPLAEHRIWLTLDPITRRILIGLPTNAASAPNLILPLDFRELDTATDLANRTPIHISFTGKMICSDLSRKWTRWNVFANCASMLVMSGEDVSLCIGGGNGQTPGLSNGFGNVYWFDPAKLTDDDFGQVTPYYITYFFVNHELEQILQVGLHRKLFKRFAIFISGVGMLSITPYADSLANPVAGPPLQPLLSNPTHDTGDGLNVQAERAAFKIASVPNIGQTDNSFNVGKFIVVLCQEPVAPIAYGAV